MRIRDWSSDVCSSDLVLGILSSQIHVAWALAAGGRLGVGNDPVYVKTTCFDPFPFPDPPEALKARIRDLGERLDAQRKAVRERHERPRPEGRRLGKGVAGSVSVGGRPYI